MSLAKDCMFGLGIYLIGLSIAQMTHLSIPMVFWCGWVSHLTWKYAR